MRILGLDISSTTCGIGLLEFNPCTQETKFLSAEFYKPPKTGSLFERLKKTESEMQSIFDRLQPDVITIEDILFFNKRSTMRTLILLGIFNRQVGLTAAKWLQNKNSHHSIWPTEPILFPVATIRATLKKIFSLQEIKKEDIPNLLQQKFSSFPLEKNKSTKKSKIIQNETLKKETYDMADGVAVALTYIEKHCLGRANKTKRKSK